MQHLVQLSWTELLSKDARQQIDKLGVSSIADSYCYLNRYHFRGGANVRIMQVAEQAKHGWAA